MISITILTKNNAKTIQGVLNALDRFDDIVILDTGSKDRTLEYAKAYKNVRIFSHEFVGFGALHNIASNHAKHGWIFSVDSDEVASKELVEEVINLNLSPNTVYSIRRHNFFNGKHIKWCGWSPDYTRRLYHRSTTSFTDDAVHETIAINGCNHTYLKAPIYHYSYNNISDFLIKMEHYTTLFANHNTQKNVSMLTVLSHTIFAFFKSYFLKCGFSGGKEGFVISMYNAQTAYYKYLKILFNK